MSGNKWQQRPISLELVFCEEENVFTTSLIVAKVFEKEHKHVLDAIRNLECSEKFTQSNFRQCFRINELANGKRVPYYEITRDGCMFLVMGFTGKKAAQWKEKFIEAFGKMEEQLRQRFIADRSRAAKRCTPKFVMENTVRNHQINNSNVINTWKVRSKQDDAYAGRLCAQNYNRRNCIAITEQTPKDWRDFGTSLGLPRYVCRSAKEVARSVQPEMASARSMADELVQEGIAELVAFEIGRAMIHPFKLLLDADVNSRKLM